MQGTGGVVDLVHARALLHRVENLLRSGFGADPDRAAARRRQQTRDVVGDPVSPQQALERGDGVLADDKTREVFDPARLQPEDVVGDPEMIRMIGSRAATQSRPRPAPAIGAEYRCP